MKTKTFSLFALCLLMSAAMLACGGAADNTANTTNTVSTTNSAGKANTANTANTASSTTASADKIGVPECDDFITKYEACVTGKVPAAQQAAFKSSIETWRKSWKDLAANPQTKATLTSVCKTQLDQAKTSLSSFGCTW